ncbi:MULTISPECIES: hypothetical protein [Rhodococcus]|uniref:hypothetical protein n=1 Tax=Rhodococcus TaxID=1827 RepID=UPI00071E6003|nr:MULTISPECIES: hypothetical protein [Rhodococcus]ANQ75596.1 hypothetical protein AOT96_31735 [Rhodococcus sp. 008]KSU70583.1 hypothetical protein AS032_26925 [Rhodococcus qingshengii]SCC64063.1 hypothetical protein GA0061093_11749 [Rhodococcus qingshengii]
MPVVTDNKDRLNAATTQLSADEGGQVRRNVVLRSDPVEVGTFEVSDDGVAIIDLVASDVPAGEHHLELRGDDGSVYRMPILVTDTPVTDGPVGSVVDGSTMHVPGSSGTGSVGS